MYAMDARMYDPAIGRWVVQDPVVHYNYSPYNAFDNNPVFWADPSGADSEDSFGRSTSENGRYIPVSERPSIHGDFAAASQSSSALEYAKLSKHVYGEGGDTGDWKQVGKLYESKKGTGFKAALYKKGSMYALAIAGTEDFMKDGKADVAQILGISAQYSEGLTLAENLLQDPLSEVFFKKETYFRVIVCCAKSPDFVPIPISN